MPESNLLFLFAGFAVVWLLLGAYLVRLWRAQRDVGQRLDRLEGRAGGAPDEQVP